MITLVTGTRPNLVKVAPLIRELKKRGVEYRWVHTGQHYDDEMFRDHLGDLDLENPIYLSGFEVDPPDLAKVAARIGVIVQDLSYELSRRLPKIVVAFGDVDSTLATAITANKMGIKLAHVEAGERSGDRSMPEEINRILVDELSDYLFCASEASMIRFLHDDRAHLVGNLMIDQLRHTTENPKAEYIIQNRDYAVATLHRQANVDTHEVLFRAMNILEEISDKIDIIFPVHPRTRKVLDTIDLHFYSPAFDMKSIDLIEPLPYNDFVELIRHAKFVITDSGGLQVEASYLNIPCITLRNETEWPATVSRGTNYLAGSPECAVFRDSGGYPDIEWAVETILKGEWKQSKFGDDPLYQSSASEKIVDILVKELK